MKWKETLHESPAFYTINGAKNEFCPALPPPLFSAPLIPSHGNPGAAYTQPHPLLPSKYLL